MWGKIGIALVLFVKLCDGVIYHLNASEHDRFPPIFGLEDYSRCLRVPGSRYCVAKFTLHAQPGDELMDIMREYTEHTVKHYNYTYIDRGVCISSQTCNQFIGERDVNIQADLDAILEACVNDTVYNQYRFEAKLDTIYSCDKEEASNVELSDWIVAGCFAALIFISILGTFYHWVLYLVRDEKTVANGKSLMLCFSIYQNWLHLVAPSSTDSKIARLKGFHGIKSVATFMIMLPHVLWIVVSFNDNPHDFETNYEVPFYQMLNNGLVIVQTFFVISGFLLVYNLELYAEKRHVDWWLFPKIMFLRWWRLTPTNAALIAFTATWMRHIGSGPLWNMMVSDTVSRDCRKYWWSHIFYFNNYIPDDIYCAIQTWYIAVDTQLFTLGLLVYIGTRNRGRSAVLSLLLLLGMLAPALHVWLQDLDGALLLTPQFQRAFDAADTFTYVHKPGHNNLPCYIIGMATAYLVFHWRKIDFDISKNKVCVRLTWCIIPGIAAMFYSGRVFYSDGSAPSLAVRIVYGATHRVALGLIVGFGMIGLVTKFDVTLRRIFEWRGWAVPSRLSYCMYLAHVNVIHYLAATKTTLNHVSTFNILYNHLGVAFVSFLLAWPLHLLVEAPLNRLMKIIFKMDDYRQSTEKEREQNVP